MLGGKCQAKTRVSRFSRVLFRERLTDTVRELRVAAFVSSTLKTDAIVKGQLVLQSPELVRQIKGEVPGRSVVVPIAVTVGCCGLEIAALNIDDLAAIGAFGIFVFETSL